MADLTVIGGGLAGSEAALQAARSGLKVILYEMRPVKMTGAHVTDKLAELVCSNSLGSNLPNRASSLLKEELRKLGSIVLDAADKSKIPAGGALAVDRDQFASDVTRRITNHPNISLIREEIIQIPDGPVIIASGPLTSPDLVQGIQELTGEDNLYFFDAIAPVIYGDSINMEIAFRASRYRQQEEEGGDYINCPLTENEYADFVDALIQAQRIPLRAFEAMIENGISAGAHHFFEGCLPVEIIARRGRESLAYGPMRPVGLTNPHNDTHPQAVVQLRQDNLAASMFNMVGFQTNLTYSEQKKVFRMIPGLEKAEFFRFGQMHRNTFITSPRLLLPTMQFRQRNELFFAGQITGVEGYMGNIGTGWLAGVNATRLIQGEPLLQLPITTMLGALCHYITHADLSDFQPMKSNFGIMPPLEKKYQTKVDRAANMVKRALRDLDQFIDAFGISVS